MKFYNKHKKYVLSFSRRDNYKPNFDSILPSPDDECFQIVILFLVSSQYISNSLKHRNIEHYHDQKVISQQELRVHICCTRSINNVDVCFDYRYSTAALKIEVKNYAGKTYQSFSVTLCQG